VPDNLVAERCKRLARQLLVRERTYASAVSTKRDATLERGPNDRDRLLALVGRTVAEAVARGYDDVWCDVLA